ncbi:zinc knuckle CX2CX4HX4C containing protein [Tanacetum coccineum]
MSNTSDKGTMFGDGAAWVGMQLRSSPKLINDIDAGKHDELLSELTNKDRMETLEALDSICNSIKVDRNNADIIPCKVSYADDSINLNVDESTIPSDPIVQSVDINKSTSYAGVAGESAKDQPNVNSNFCALVADPVFDGVNIYIPRKVIEKAGLEAVLEGCPWLICKSPINLKKWLMDTRLLKEELTRILIWVKLHDVPIQVFEEDDISLISSFIGKPVMLDSYTNSMCNDSWGRSSFARCLIKVVSPPIVATSNVVIPNAEKTNDGFQTVGKKNKRNGKSKSTNGGQFTGPSVKHNTTSNSSKKDNLSMSNSFSTLNEEKEEDEEDVENVYDESANLIQNTKAGGSLSFTAATS